MRNIGSLLALLGIFAIGLDFVDRVPSFLFWIYNWGDAAAWAIKIGLVVVGGLMYFLGSAEPDGDSSE